MSLSGTVMEIWRLKDMTVHTHGTTDTYNDGQNDQSHKRFQCSLTFTLGGDKNLYVKPKRTRRKILNPLCG